MITSFVQHGKLKFNVERDSASLPVDNNVSTFVGALYFCLALESFSHNALEQAWTLMRYFIARWDIESFNNTLFFTNEIYGHSTDMEPMLTTSGLILFAHSDNKCCCSYHVSGDTSGVFAGRCLSGVDLPL